MNYSMILSVIGKVLTVESVFLLPALVISLCCGEGAAAMGLGITMALLVAVGLPLGLHKPKRTDFFARDGLAIACLTWLAVSAFGALPFCISGAIPNYIDCLFETVSGFTTTGATILANVEALPMGLLYWRSFTHWLGGMGVLVFLLILNPLSAKNSGENMHILRAESPGIKIAKLVPRMRDSASILYRIYIALTVLEFILLLCGRMPAFDALCLSFGTAGTGGFGVRNDSAASYSPYCQWVITIFMLLFSVNFNVYFLLLLRRWKKALGSEELRLFAGVVAGSVLIISANVFRFFSGVEETLRHAAFQVASIISTTGFSTVDFDAWPELSRALLLLLMFFGACAGSTGGGLKSVRVLVMLKAVRRAVNRVFHPNAVRLVHMDGEVLDDDTVNNVCVYFVLYAFILCAAVLLVTLDGLSYETSFSAVAACLNNIGPGLGLVGPSLHYDCFSWLSKIVLLLSMLVGRLEIYPMLLLVMPRLWKKK